MAWFKAVNAAEKSLAIARICGGACQRRYFKTGDGAALAPSIAAFSVPCLPIGQCNDEELTGFFGVGRLHL
jgi:hypothetical protein